MIIRARCTGGSIPVLTASKAQTLRIDTSSYRTRAKHSHEHCAGLRGRPLMAVWEDLAGHQSCARCQYTAPAAVEETRQPISEPRVVSEPTSRAVLEDRMWHRKVNRGRRSRRRPLGNVSAQLSKEATQLWLCAFLIIDVRSKEETQHGQHLPEQLRVMRRQTSTVSCRMTIVFLEHRWLCLEQPMPISSGLGMRDAYYMHLWLRVQ
jgi:hypothetical protein